MAQYSRKLKKGKGIKWWYKFDYKHQTYSSGCIYLSKNEAKAAEIERLRELSLEDQKSIQKPILSLLEAINERLDTLQVKKSKNYYNDNKRYYTKLLEKFGDIPIDVITRKDINEFLNDEAQKAEEAGRDKYAINYMLNLFSALFNTAIETHELEIRNPCKGIELFPVKKKLKYIPSDDDIQDVKSLCDEEQILLIDFVAETGARISEPLKVTGKDIFDEFVVLYTKKSRNSNIVPRKVPKPDCIKHITISNDERLFSRWIDAPKFLERKIKILRQKNWNWHNLRHRRASLWSKEGLPLYEIMSRLGHSNLSTTQKYLQLLS